MYNITVPQQYNYNLVLVSNLNTTKELAERLNLGIVVLFNSVYPLLRILSGYTLPKLKLGVEKKQHINIL